LAHPPATSRLFKSQQKTVNGPGENDDRAAHVESGRATKLSLIDPLPPGEASANSLPQWRAIALAGERGASVTIAEVKIIRGIRQIPGSNSARRAARANWDVCSASFCAIGF
jgi:hypothetical protein